MKSNKRWKSLIRTESEDLTKQISWDSSSSEESETEENKPKRFKSHFPNFQKQMGLTAVEPIEVNKIQIDEVKGIKNFAVSQISSFQSDECVIDFKSDSPILNSKIVFSNLPSSDSPILSQNYIFRETSPVLVGREIIKSIKRKKNEIRERGTKIDGSSPDILFTQESNIIEENDSPIAVKSATTNCSQDLGSIELASSQESSSIVIINSSTSENSVVTSDINSECYHQPSPRRKKFKKDGLLYQLKKTLNLQKSRISLWHHDIFCKKFILSDLEHIKGVINDKWRDFSCTILKCSKLDSINSNSEVMFLISLGCTTDSHLALGDIITIYQPFKQKSIQFENKETLLFYNVSKLITESKKDSIT